LYALVKSVTKFGAVTLSIAALIDCSCLIKNVNAVIVRIIIALTFLIALFPW